MFSPLVTLVATCSVLLLAKAEDTTPITTADPTQTTLPPWKPQWCYMYESENDTFDEKVARHTQCPEHEPFCVYSVQYNTTYPYHWTCLASSSSLTKCGDSYTYETGKVCSCCGDDCNKFLDSTKCFPEPTTTAEPTTQTQPITTTQQPTTTATAPQNATTAWAGQRCYQFKNLYDDFREEDAVKIECPQDNPFCAWYLDEYQVMLPYVWNCIASQGGKIQKCGDSFHEGVKKVCSCCGDYCNKNVSSKTCFPDPTTTAPTQPPSTTSGATGLASSAILTFPVVLLARKLL